MVNEMGVADWFSCSGRRSERSMFSQLMIFCNSLGGKLGIPGMGAMRGESAGVVEVEAGVWRGVVE